MVVLECKSKPDQDSSPILFFYTNPKEDDEIVQSLYSFAKLTAKPPLLVLFDIPDQKRYVSEATDVNEKAVREIVEGYREQSILGEQLR